MLPCLQYRICPDDAASYYLAYTYVAMWKPTSQNAAHKLILNSTHKSKTMQPIKLQIFLTDTSFRYM